GSGIAEAGQDEHWRLVPRASALAAGLLLAGRGPGRTTADRSLGAGRRRSAGRTRCPRSRRSASLAFDGRRQLAGQSRGGSGGRSSGGGARFLDAGGGRRDRADGEVAARDGGPDARG